MHDGARVAKARCELSKDVALGSDLAEASLPA